VDARMAGLRSNMGTSSAVTAPPRSAPLRTALGVHFSGKCGDWRTPPVLWNRLLQEFAFDLDVAATPEDRLIGVRSAGWDALEPLASWGYVNYINPPYGNVVGKWIDAVQVHNNIDAATVVMLLPARTDTLWWHGGVHTADEVRFIKGRLKFLNKDGLEMSSAPFPSCVAVWYPRAGLRKAAPRFSTFQW